MSNTLSNFSAEILLGLSIILVRIGWYGTASFIAVFTAFCYLTSGITIALKPEVYRGSYTLFPPRWHLLFNWVMTVGATLMLLHNTPVGCRVAAVILGFSLVAQECFLGSSRRELRAQM